MFLTSLSSFWRSAVLSVALTLCVGPLWANPPSGAGQGKHSGAKSSESKPKQTSAANFSFNSEDRQLAADYYGKSARADKCPPGLAKKNNGCQPPGQAKKWQKGQPLAKDILVYPLPRELRIKLPAPPPEHRYVRVARDILLIAIGTKIVVDAMEDILQ